MLVKEGKNYNLIQLSYKKQWMLILEIDKDLVLGRVVDIVEN